MHATLTTGTGNRLGSNLYLFGSPHVIATKRNEDVAFIF